MGDRGPDVLRRQMRIVFAQFGLGRALGQLVEDKFDGKARSPNHRLAHHHRRVDLDSIGRHRGLSELGEWCLPIVASNSTHASQRVDQGKGDGLLRSHSESCGISDAVSLRFAEAMITELDGVVYQAVSGIVRVSRNDAADTPNCLHSKFGDPATCIFRKHVGDQDAVGNVNRHLLGPKNAAHDLMQAVGRVQCSLVRRQDSPKDKPVRNTWIIFPKITQK